MTNPVVAFGFPSQITQVEILPPLSYGLQCWESHNLYKPSVFFDCEMRVIKVWFSYSYYTC